MMASKRWRTDTKTPGGQKLCIRWHNQQLFTNKAALGPVRQITDIWLIWLGHISFNLVDFQRPDRVCSFFGPAFKFAGLIQISHIDKWRNLFSFDPTGLEYFVDGFEETAFSLTATAGFFPIRLVTSLLSALTTSGSFLTHTVNRCLSGKSIPTAY